MPSRSLLLFIALVWLACTAFSLIPNGDSERFPVAFVSSVALYLFCWWRVPVAHITARRAFLDHGAFTVLASLVLAKIDPTPWPLIACPLLALTLGYHYRCYVLPRPLRRLEPLGQTLARFALLAIHLPNAIGIGVFALRIYQDSGAWPTAFFLLLCLLHAIASIKYHLKHPA